MRIYASLQNHIYDKSLGGRMHPKDALKFIKSPLVDGYISQGIT